MVLPVIQHRNSIPRFAGTKQRPSARPLSAFGKFVRRVHRLDELIGAS